MINFNKMINRVILGDCLKVMEKISNGKVDMILTDLPYGATACKWDIVIPFEPLWEQYKRVVKKNGCIALFGTEPFSSLLRLSNLEMYKYDWIWYKNVPSGFAIAKKQPMRNNELISIFYNKQCIYNPIKEVRDLNENSKKRIKYKYTTEKGINSLQGGIRKIASNFLEEKRYPTTVKKFKCVPTSKGRLHPTQKLVKLFEYLIRTYTNKGDLVLDSCAGSFTTAIAAINLKRNWICIEKERKYCEIGLKRIFPMKVLEK